MRSKILLTGGSGFIGRNILEYLEQKYTVLAPAYDELDILNHFLVDDFIKNNKIDIIIHTAVGRGNTVFKDTLRMFFNIVRNSDKVKKIIIFGSGAEYNKKRNLIEVTEDEIGKYIPEDNYGLAKYYSNEVTRGIKNVVNLRLFGVFGKYEGYRFKFISNSIVKALLDLNIEIAQDVIFDYLYMDDLVHILQHFIENNFEYSDYNITPTESVSLIEITEIIMEITKNKSEVVTMNEGKNYQYTGSNNRLIEFVGNFTFTPYKESISQLINYYDQDIEKLDKNLIVEDIYLKRSMKNIVENR